MVRKKKDLHCNPMKLVVSYLFLEGENGTALGMEYPRAGGGLATVSSSERI